jgi:hypothetical protein
MGLFGGVRFLVLCPFLFYFVSDSECERTISPPSLRRARTSKRTTKKKRELNGRRTKKPNTTGLAATCVCGGLGVLKQDEASTRGEKSVASTDFFRVGGR